MDEACVGAPGWRRLLKFSTQTANISQNSFDLGDPTTEPGFQYDTCHQHYHYVGWANYELLDQAANVAAPGHKQAFCVVEIAQYLFEPWVGPQTHSCEFQGLNGGWSDIYDREVDCQWVDVTGVPGGTYDLSVTVNPERKIRESDYGNNVGSCTLTFPDPDLLPDLIPDAAAAQSTLGVQLVNITQNSLANQDGCAGGTGPRRLLTFTMKVINPSEGDLHVGNPADIPSYTFVPTHAHYHTPGVATFELVDPDNGSVVAMTSPPSWLFSDGVPWVSAPWVQPDPWYTLCGAPQCFSTNAGLQRGWESLEITNGVCQWIDVTAVPDGDYVLRLTVNPVGFFAESDLSNNSVEIPFVLNAQPPSVADRPDGDLVPGTPLTVSRRLRAGEPPMFVTDVTYDVTSCPAPIYNLYYSEDPPGDYTYTGAVCDLGDLGNTPVEFPDPAPGKLIWFLVAGQDGNAGGGHGFDGFGQPRPMAGIGFCGVLQPGATPTCP